MCVRKEAHALCTIYRPIFFISNMFFFAVCRPPPTPPRKTSGLNNTASGTVLAVHIRTLVQPGFFCKGEGLIRDIRILPDELSESLKRSTVLCTLPNYRAVILRERRPYIIKCEIQSWR